MSTTFTITDKNYKYACCYGGLSGIMVMLQDELDFAKKHNQPISMERIEKFLAMYRAVDDALKATSKD